MITIRSIEDLVDKVEFLLSKVNEDDLPNRYVRDTEDELYNIKLDLRWKRFGEGLASEDELCECREKIEKLKESLDDLANDDE